MKPGFDGLDRLLTGHPKEALALPGVEAAVKALKGEKLPKIIDTGFYYYDKTNMKDTKIAAVLYD